MKPIILEGPNGSGKSTLGQQLAEEFGIRVKHAGPSPGDDDAAVLATFKQVKWLGKGRILDRCTPISRQVYEQPIEIGHLEDLKLTARIFSQECIVIHCTGIGEFTDKLYYPHGHFEEIVRDQDRIRKAYDRVMSEIPHIRYNWETDDFNELVEKIRSWNHTA